MVPTFDGNTLENESFSSGGHSDPCGAGPQILRKSCEVKIQARRSIVARFFFELNPLSKIKVFFCKSIPSSFIRFLIASMTSGKIVQSFILPL